MDRRVTPQVSVILCTYNQGRYLQQAIDSVKAQTFQNWELLIVDNGSTDGSDEIIRDAAASEPRISAWLHSVNEPVTKRLNEAIAQATGEWISILYGDDYYLPTKLGVQLTVAETLDERIIYGPGYRLHSDDTLTVDPTCKASGQIFIHLLRHAIGEGFINPISPLIRRDCFSPTDSTPELDVCIPGEPFDETVFMEGETWFWRAAKRWHFHYLDVPLVVMRSHDRNEGLNVERNFNLALTLHDKLVASIPEHWRPEQEAMLAYYDALRVHFAWCAIRMKQDRELAWKILRPLKRFPRSKRELATRLAIASDTLMRGINALKPQPSLG